MKARRNKSERPGKEQFCRPTDLDGFRHCPTKTSLRNVKKITKPKFVTKQSALRIDKKYYPFKRSPSSSDLECRKTQRTIKISPLGTKVKKKIASGQTKIYSTPPNAPMKKKNTPKTTTYTCTTEPLIVLKSSELDLASGIDRMVQLQDIINPPSIDLSSSMIEKEKFFPKVEKPPRQVTPENQTDILKEKIDFDKVLEFEDFIPNITPEAHTKAIGLVDIDNIHRIHHREPNGLDKEVIQRFRQGIASFTEIEEILPLDGVFREELRTEKPKCKEKPKNETDVKIEKKIRDQSKHPTSSHILHQIRDQSKLPTSSQINIFKKVNIEEVKKDEPVPKKASITKITVNRSQAMSRVSSISTTSKETGEPEGSPWSPYNWTTNQLIAFGLLITLFLAVLGLYSRADFDYDD